ncbi:response regulator transcription factor [Sinomonas soli]
MGADQRTRVLLVSAYRPLLSALRELLEDEGVDVVGESGTVTEGARLARRCAPQVMVLDEHLPDGDAEAMCRQLSESGTPTRCVILTSLAARRGRGRPPGDPIFVVRKIADSGLPQAVRAAASLTPAWSAAASPRGCRRP